jgi:hypothetical protein
MQDLFPTLTTCFLFLCPAISWAQTHPADAPPKPGVLTKVRFFAMPRHEQDLAGGQIVASEAPAPPPEESNGLPISIEKFTVLAEIKTAPAPGQWGELPIENNATPYRRIAYAAPAPSPTKAARQIAWSNPSFIPSNA